MEKMADAFTTRQSVWSSLRPRKAVSRTRFAAEEANEVRLLVSGGGGTAACSGAGASLSWVTKVFLCTPNRHEGQWGRKYSVHHLLKGTEAPAQKDAQAPQSRGQSHGIRFPRGST